MLTREEIKDLKKGDFVKIVYVTYPLSDNMIGCIYEVYDIIYIHDEKFDKPSIYLAVYNQNRDIIHINAGFFEKIFI